ncbi:ABC transporter ATP-binding protein [bacterium]|nr:ABC transporter ATP-binding protein [bacterium]
MHSDVAIRTEGLGKSYQIGSAAHLSRNLRETLMDLPRALHGKALSAMRRLAAGPRPDSDPNTFWALRDFNLDVKRGEVVGIIGRNGAGKSTLLKVLSRITAPTVGRAEIHGRVGSLLEVGTGFHPELSGRENVYLNGAILGMRKAEIERKFDEIVAFSEVDRFIDTPVKRYSSGMRVRLGFAVAAFLDPEILFVDEVLAVGDAGFRKKCLGKMGNIAEHGRTILFVSHNMAAIANLCTRAIIIHEGHCIRSGEPRAVIQEYLDRFGDEASNPTSGVFDLGDRQNSYGDRRLIVRRVEVLDREYQPRQHFLMGDKIAVRVHLDGFSDYSEATIGLTIKDSQDQWLASLNTAMNCHGIKEPRQWAELATLEIEKLPLLPGTYYLAISATLGPSGGFQRIDYVDRAAVIDVTEADVYGSGYKMERKYGVFFLDGAWTIQGRDDGDHRAGTPCV